MDPNTQTNIKILFVNITDPEKLLFQGNAEAITTFNDTGKFDVLPMHENFITLIKDKIIVHIKVGGETREFKIEKGVLRVSNNKVQILTGFELLEEEE